MYIVVGLGNPGSEYEHTRHNTGRRALDFIEDKIASVKTLAPESYMNRSGSVVAKVVKSKAAAKKLMVIYDDLDLPLGKFKISYNRSSGGHKGLESIIKALKTKEFIRIRVGISSTTPSGKLKKPKSDKDIEKFILGNFKKSEEEILNKVFKEVQNAVEVIIKEGLTAAQTKFNK